MLVGCRVLGPRTNRGRTGMARAAAVFVAVAAVSAGTTSCGGAAPQVQQSQVRPAARTRLPASATSVLTGAPDTVAEGVASRLFVSSPVVVVASLGLADLANAARAASRSHAPLLLTPAGTGGAPPTLRAQIKALDPRAVLAVGVSGNVLAAALPGIHVVTNPAMLPATKAPAPLGHLALLVHPGDSDAATLAAVTTAQVAGARVIAVRDDDPHADPADIAALSAARPRQVLAIGAGFGPADRLASRIAVAQTGVQLPGGGQILFPLHRLVALYGPPGAPALGALGHQGLQPPRAGQERCRAVPAADAVPVVPAFEIIATVAQAAAGPDGTYSASPGGLPAPLGTAGHGRRDVRHPGPAARPGQPARPGPAIPAAAPSCPMSGWPWTRSGSCSPGSGRCGRSAASDRRGQQRHQLAGRAHREVPPAAEAPRAAPVPAVYDQRRATARYPARRPGHRDPHGRAGHARR